MKSQKIIFLKMKPTNHKPRTVNYLLLDTSCTKAQIGLADESKIFDKKIWDSYQNLSDKLLPNIDKLLQKNKLKAEDLSGIIIYLGPGTFTGLRIGVTIANAFAYSLDIPIAGIKGKSLGKEKFEIKELKPIELDELLRKGLKEISKKEKGKYVTPFYGKKPNVR